MMDQDDPRVMSTLYNEEESASREYGPDPINYAHEEKILIRKWRWLMGYATVDAGGNATVKFSPPAGHFFIVRHIATQVTPGTGSSRVYLDSLDPMNFIAKLETTYGFIGDQFIYVPENSSLLLVGQALTVGSIYYARALVAVAQFETILLETAPRCKNCNHLITSCICVSEKE